MLNKKSRGFTLVELLIVIIIIGILATMAIPQYQKMVDRAKWAGPVQMLGTIKEVALVYYMANQAYPITFASMDMDDPSPSGSFQRNQFRYSFVSSGQEPGGHYLIVMVYKDLNGDGAVSNPDGQLGFDPHIWIYDDGSFSSRTGAPFINNNDGH